MSYDDIKEPMPSYCTYVSHLDQSNVHRVYHDTQYGFPIHDDNLLFERLVLEINQAGLSWETILKKQEGFRRAYRQFDIERVARFDEKDRERLLNDASIIRNRLKVNAAIENARRIMALQKEHGSFQNWLETHHPLSKDEWVKLFKKTFVFVGGEIVNEFLMSSGYLPGAHEATCPIFKKIEKQKPMWMRRSSR
jgi:DNA-3-methyladenine glycosylase I